MAASATSPNISHRPEVRAFWTGPQLSPYEELSLRSFVAAGARMLLYSNRKDLRVPEGVELVDVNEILGGQVQQFTFPDGDRSSALHSDLFRYAAIQQFGGWYTDLDIVLVAKELPRSKVYIARESDNFVNGAVMKFPVQSPVMAAAIEEAWKLVPETGIGAPLSARLSIGPALVTQLTRDYALDHLVRPRSSAYEIGYDEIPAMFDPNFREILEERVKTSDFVHLWNEIWRRVRIPKTYGPPAGSFLDNLFRRFGMSFTNEERLSSESVAAWFREHKFLAQVRARLSADAIPRNALEQLSATQESQQPDIPSPPQPQNPAASRLSAASVQTVRTLWHGGQIGVYQLLCLRSFVDRGHRVQVYTFDSSIDLPSWIERKNAAEIAPADRMLRYLPQQRRSAIHADLFRYALLHRLGGWWIDPDVVLLKTELPEGELFVAGLTESGVVSTAAMKLPSGDPILADALMGVTSYEERVADWALAGAPLLTQCLKTHGAIDALQPIALLNSFSWFEVPSLFDPDQADAVVERLQNRPFLDLHYEAWLRAGVPNYLGPPRGSFLDKLLQRHDTGMIFSARMEFDDVRRWMSHMYECVRRGEESPSGQQIPRQNQQL